MLSRMAANFQNSEDEARAQILGTLLKISDVREIIQQQIQAGFAQLESVIARTNSPDPDCWLDANAAAKYMCVSKSSFDKYRYDTSPKLTGYRLDGKVLYKKTDIDRFIKLYAVKSNGLA
jgi:hypothetical protein